VNLKYDERGLIPAVVQDRFTGEVRMVAWMNAESLKATEETGIATFFSRSRDELWVKGATSGNRLKVASIAADCDADTLVLQVDPEGPSCHTGRESCFFRDFLRDESDERAPFLVELERVIAERERSSAEKSYTRSLLDGGPERIGAKLSEEAGELSLALQAESDERVTAEAADVLFHLLVGLRARRVSLRAVVAELARRSGTSGHAEKASRGRD
jgi:phosphoribosyl-ATP pyrophosphohydrolase/phosphoribosyl-AMP cyclohydrolase